MNIIICGAGKVGFSISKQLSSQGHSVTVIDQSSEDIKKINDTQDAKGIVGRASLPSVLENAGAENTDMIIALTPYVLGSKNTVSLFEGMSFPELKTKLPLKLKNVQKSGNEIILNYKI